MKFQASIGAPELHSGRRTLIRSIKLETAWGWKNGEDQVAGLGLYNRDMAPA